jgi:hypothetical protein
VLIVNLPEQIVLCLTSTRSLKVPFIQINFGGYGVHQIEMRRPVSRGMRYAAKEDVRLCVPIGS